MYRAVLSMEQEVELEPKGVEQLPPDVLLTVFSHCDTKALLAASGTCRQWHELADSDVLWERLLKVRWQWTWPGLA